MVYTYEQFPPNFGAGVPTIKAPGAVAKVEVREIRLHSVPDVLPPKLQGETVVSDRRYAVDLKNGPATPRPKPGSIVSDGMYSSSSGQLPEQPAADAIKKFEQQRTARIKKANLRSRNCKISNLRNLSRTTQRLCRT